MSPERRVITVSGPVGAGELGVTDGHEHLFLRSPALRGQELEDLDATTREVAEGVASGIGTIVELTPIGLGRRPDLLRRVAEATGARIVAATGYHRDEHYPAGHWVHDAPVELLAERMMADIERGMHPRDWTDAAEPDAARAGVIKAGASYHRISRSERRRLEAIAGVARRTGLAIVVHTEIGTAGPEIVEVLTGLGLPVDRIVLAHLDRNPDHELHLELAGRGAMLVYDTVGRIKYRPDSELLALIESMVAAGHLERIMLGLDLGRRDYLRAYGGGPGMRYLLDTFVPRLRRRIGPEAVDTILVANPARAYAVSPAREAAG